MSSRPKGPGGIYLDELGELLVLGGGQVRIEDESGNRTLVAVVPDGRIMVFSPEPLSGVPRSRLVLLRRPSSLPRRRVPRQGRAGGACALAPPLPATARNLTNLR